MNGYSIGDCWDTQKNGRGFRPRAIKWIVDQTISKGDNQWRDSPLEHIPAAGLVQTSIMIKTSAT